MSNSEYRNLKLFLIQTVYPIQRQKPKEYITPNSNSSQSSESTKTQTHSNRSNFIFVIENEISKSLQVFMFSFVKKIKIYINLIKILEVFLHHLLNKR